MCPFYHVIFSVIYDNLLLIQGAPDSESYHGVSVLALLLPEIN